ncbi:MAG: hypothetical protein AAFY12_12340 [Pseudomonadota bacterium]
MSAAAENWADRRADEMAMAIPSARRTALMALAGHHDSGPVVIPTQLLAEELGWDIFSLWRVLFALHFQDVIRASNIGGLMSVTFAFDFDETSATCDALPQDMEGLA